MLITIALVLPGAYVAATSGTATTTNSSPTVDSIVFYTTDPSASASSTCPAGSATSFAPAAGADRTIYVCAVVSDANGWQDVCDSTSSNDARTFDVTTSADALLGDPTADKDNELLTCATGSGTSVAVTGSFAMEYWHPPVSGVGGYKVTVTATDVASASGSSSAQFDYTSLTALDQTTTGTINYGGALAPGATGSEQTVALYNDGNVAFTIHVSGNALTGGTHGGTISVGNLKWATSASVAYADKTALSGTVTTTGLSAPLETSDTPTARNVYVQLAVPAGSGQWVPAQTWTNTVTFATSAS